MQELTRDGRIKGDSFGPTSLVTDGERIYFTELAGVVLGGDPAYYRVHVPDLKVERVVRLKGYRRPFGFIGAFSGLTPDGSLRIGDDVGWHEIYALDLKLP
jgi:hypothetical protein